MRGILIQDKPPLKRVRITPAHAGNTVLGVVGDFVGEDHPRACGEYIHDIFLFLPQQGSPPRMRGIPIGDYFGLPTNGITPAHAGNTLSVVASS